VALLVHALAERKLRRAMADAEVKALPLYYEDRLCPAPTAARVVEILESLCTTTVQHDGVHLTEAPPRRDALQKQVLALLKVPHRAYESAPRTSAKCR
jgi:hypothetical protein